jgi:hypothetical protein
MPGTRAIALPTALLLASAAFACSIAVGGMFLLLTLVVASGHAEVALHDAAWAVWCGAAAGACGTVAALIALTRAAGGLRPLALAAAWAIAFAWPLTGATPAAVVALVAIGFVVRWGASGTRAGRDGLPGATVLAAAALVLLSAAFGGAPGAQLPAEARAEAGSPRERATTPPPEGQAERSKAAPRPRRRAARSSAPPSSVVLDYYRALDRRDFLAAWRVLSPGVRAGFGGLERWRAGFAATRSSRPSELHVAATGDGAVVEHDLTARDTAACGVLVQRFSVRWRLRRTPDRWRAAELTAAALGSTCA